MGVGNLLVVHPVSIRPYGRRTNRQQTGQYGSHLLQCADLDVRGDMAGIDAEFREWLENPYCSYEIIICIIVSYVCMLNNEIWVFQEYNIHLITNTRVIVSM